MSISGRMSEWVWRENEKMVRKETKARAFEEEKRRRVGFVSEERDKAAFGLHFLVRKWIILYRKLP